MVERKIFRFLQYCRKHDNLGMGMISGSCGLSLSYLKGDECDPSLSSHYAWYFSTLRNDMVGRGLYAQIRGLGALDCVRVDMSGEFHLRVYPVVGNKVLSYYVPLRFVEMINNFGDYLCVDRNPIVLRKGSSASFRKRVSLNVHDRLSDSNRVSLRETYRKMVAVLD